MVCKGTRTFDNEQLGLDISCSSDIVVDVKLEGQSKLLLFDLLSLKALLATETAKTTKVSTKAIAAKKAPAKKTTAKA